MTCTHCKGDICDSCWKARTDAFRALDEIGPLRERHDLVVKREAELHYAIRREANILDHKLTETDAHATALFRVAKMHDVVEAAHEVNRQMKATNGKVTIGAWTKLADALDMRVPAEAK